MVLVLFLLDLKRDDFRRSLSEHHDCETMDVDYGDITSEDAVDFCLNDPEEARKDILTLLQVRRWV